MDLDVMWYALETSWSDECLLILSSLVYIQLRGFWKAKTKQNKIKQS